MRTDKAAPRRDAALDGELTRPGAGAPTKEMPTRSATGLQPESERARLDTWEGRAMRHIRSTSFPIHRALHPPHRAPQPSGHAAAIDTRFALLLGLVALDESHSCRKDRGKGKEQTTDHRAPMLSDEARAQRHCASENEAHHELVPARISEAREVELGITADLTAGVPHTPPPVPRLRGRRAPPAMSAR